MKQTMFIMKPYFIIICIALLLASCEKNKNTDKFNYENQKIVFQYEYVNHARINTFRGYLIDTAGNVHGYNKPEQWNFMEATGSLSVADMDSNLTWTDSVRYIIDMSELESKMELIEPASKGNISTPKNVMADAGIGVFKAFVFNIETQTYESVLIKQTGDIQIENDSQAAKDLFQWMLDINSVIW